MAITATATATTSSICGMNNTLLPMLIPHREHHNASDGTDYYGRDHRYVSYSTPYMHLLLHAIYTPPHTLPTPHAASLQCHV
jgi:hypothetical protein